MELHLNVEQSQDRWEMIGDGDPLDRLLATLWVNGCPCHLEAIRVLDPDDAGIRRAAQDDLEELIDHAAAINGEGDFQTATIGLWEYVIVATSYS